jgi:cytochrome P450
MWYITNYADARRFLADPTVSRDATAAQAVLTGGERDAMPAPDPLESHSSNQRLLRVLRCEFFGREMIGGYRVAIKRVADELLDQMPLGEPVDLIAEYALPLVIRFVSALYGLPAHHSEEFPRLDIAMHTGPTIEEVEAGGNGLKEIALQLIELKRREPADDLFTKLVRIHGAPGVAGAADLAPTLVLLLDSAMDAAAAVGNGLFVLLTHHPQLIRLATNPTQLAGAVDELLRYEPPFTTLTPRRSTRSFPLTDGTTIPAAELAMVSIAAANRDPARFPDPDRFDITRDAKTHLAFGHGPHRCAGMLLGRAAVEVALRAFIERYPNSHLARPPGELTWQVGSYVRRLETLSVVLDCGDEHKQVS